jgi:GTP cyclohydrolase I
MTPTPDGTAEAAVRALLQALGENVQREGLQQTPERVVRMLRELLTPVPFSFTTFEADGMDEMVVQAPIPFHSLCEHHMLPFVGTAAVAYIPETRLVGLSKLARTVQHCAAGLQTQERITENIAYMLRNNLKTENIAVVLRARHTCMELRGVAVSGAFTTTSSMDGAFRNDEKARAEFLRLAGL